jgi:hypothetical protein
VSRRHASSTPAARDHGHAAAGGGGEREGAAMIEEGRRMKLLPKPSADVVPFPLTRRRHFIEKTATRFLSVPIKTADKLLGATIGRAAETMLRHGVQRDLVEHECRNLEDAIRDEYWRQAFLRSDDGVA